MDAHDVVIIGGQVGLSLGYYLCRAKADFLILDAEDGCGAAIEFESRKQKVGRP